MIGDGGPLDPQRGRARGPGRVVVRQRVVADVQQLGGLDALLGVDPAEEPAAELAGRLVRGRVDPLDPLDPMPREQLPQLRRGIPGVRHGDHPHASIPCAPDQLDDRPRDAGRLRLPVQLEACERRQLGLDPRPPGDTGEHPAQHLAVRDLGVRPPVSQLALQPSLDPAPAGQHRVRGNHHSPAGQQARGLVGGGPARAERAARAVEQGIEDVDGEDAVALGLPLGRVGAWVDAKMPAEGASEQPDTRTQDRHRCGLRAPVP